MSEEQQPRIPTLRERMAALQLDQANVGRTPTSPPPTYEQAVKKAKVPPPPLPPKRPGSTNNPPVLPNGRASKAVGNQPETAQKELLPAPVMKKWEGRDQDPKPSLPPRRPTDKVAPSLPPRRPSEQSLSRQESRESLASTHSARSSISAASTPRTSSSVTSVNGQQTANKYRVRAPEYDPANLPPLPERKKTDEPKEDKPRVSLRPTISTPNVNRKPSFENRPALPSRPPLPARTSTTETPREEDALPPKPPRRSALDFALNKSTETPPPLLSDRPSSTSPPPVPLSSRPNLSELNKSKPKVNGHSATNGTHGSSSGECLLCRDFSGPDNHAARFSRQSIPSSDIRWIAQQLTSPFPSHTDKARVIFTWLHHNIAYDVKSFFGKCVKSKTPSQTVETGLAVCEGYAGLFAALATAAGLDAVVVGGHGKGVGYTALSPNAALPPPNPTGHAWNAVRIDGGAWKLVDACWGAGHVKTEDQSYHKAFNASMFTMSNDEFGERHYPENARHWHHNDNSGLSWEEYLLADLPQPRVTVYTGADTQHCLSETSFEPRGRNIAVAGGGTVRFMFRKICPHWDLASHLPGNGKPYLFLLKLNGRGGDEEEWVPFETDTDKGGDTWWCDVPKSKLGRSGQEVMCYAQTTYLDGRDGRGLTREEYFRTRPQWRSLGWGGVGQWSLV